MLASVTMKTTTKNIAALKDQILITLYVPLQSPSSLKWFLNIN